MKPGALASGLSAPFHAVLCWLLFREFGVDYLGGAQAMVVSGWLNGLLLLVIIRAQGLHLQTWGGKGSGGCFGVPFPSEHSWEEIRLFLKLAGAGVISLSEWWCVSRSNCALASGCSAKPGFPVECRASEIGILMSGLLPKPEYAVALG